MSLVTERWKSECGPLHGVFAKDLREEVLENIDTEQGAKGYYFYLKALKPYFKAFEKRLEELQDEPILKGFYDPKVLRKESIKHDATIIKDQKIEVSFSQEFSTELKETVEKIEAMKPVSLLAVAYNAITGPLLGGQKTIERLKKTQVNTFLQQAVNFYLFNLDESQEEGKNPYQSYFEGMKTRLIKLNLDEGQTDEFIKQSCEVYKFLERIVEEIKKT